MSISLFFHFYFFFFPINYDMRVISLSALSGLYLTNLFFLKRKNIEINRSRTSGEASSQVRALTNQQVKLMQNYFQMYIFRNQNDLGNP
jgi:hypothetical protein